FVAPGLYPREKRNIVPFVVAATVFFVAGAAFCYAVILGPAFQFLINSAGPDIKPMLMMDDQLGLVMTLILAFGIIFELPLVLTFLAMMGIVDHKFLNKYRRHAIVVNVIIAAFVTPTGDPFNLALMALPMMVCYGRRRSPPVLSPRVRGADGALFEKLDRLVQRRGRQVHVAHRGAQVRVTGQLLDGLRRRSAHREMRAEGVAEPMDVPGHRKA